MAIPHSLFFNLRFTLVLRGVLDQICRYIFVCFMNTFTRRLLFTTLTPITMSLCILCCDKFLRKQTFGISEQ